MLWKIKSHFIIWCFQFGHCSTFFFFFYVEGSVWHWNTSATLKINIHIHSWCTEHCTGLSAHCLLWNNTRRLFALKRERCVNIKVSLCVFFRLFTGFRIGQPGFLSLWHTQQSFLLNAMGEWTRLHNGYHLGIMRTSSMKWSCRAWQVRTMGEIWAPERALGRCSSKSTEGETIVWLP